MDILYTISLLQRGDAAEPVLGCSCPFSLCTGKLGLVHLRSQFVVESCWRSCQRSVHPQLLPRKEHISKVTVVCGLGKGRNWLSAEGRQQLGSSDERKKHLFPLRAGKFPRRQSTDR